MKLILLLTISLALFYCAAGKAIVSSATPTSGRSMEVVTDLAVGNKVWMDRNYKFTNVGNYPKECVFIRGSNNDKNTKSSIVQTKIKITIPCTVYLDFWGGAGHLNKVSSWSGSWNTASDATPTTFTGYGPGIVIKRNFDAGTINLMGNNGNGHGTYYAFVCPRVPAEIPEPTGNTNEGWCKFISAYECNDEFVRKNCSTVCDLLLPQETTTTATETECKWIDNQYWSYGDYQTVNDVSDYMTCCRLCKDDPKCTNFSYGKEGHGYAKQCMKKRGGSAQGRSEFISSPRDMTACSCGEE